MKNNIFSEDELLFKKVNSILANSSHKYWVCHGTLLGIIRDDMILPWDHDIDFAVWKDEVKVKEIENLFKKNGFEQEYIFGEMDCLHFFSKTKKVDISFYEKQNEISSIKWIAPSLKFKNKVFNFIAERICSPANIDKTDDNFKSIKSSFKFVFTKFLLFIEPIFSVKLKNKIYNHVKKEFYYTGYSYPDELMKFKKIQFLDEEIPVPIDSEKCLELTYGKDWKIPKKEYIWYDEAENLIDLKDN